MTAPRERIAIVGIGGQFPGARDLPEFWRNVLAGVDAGRQVPPSRWALSPGNGCAEWPPRADRAYSTWGCYLDDWQPNWEGLPDDPRNWRDWRLDQLDPLFTIGLNAAAMAWRDAGTPRPEPERAGVILGHIVLPTESTSALSRAELLNVFAAQVLGRPVTDPPGTNWSHENWRAAGLPAAVIARALGFAGPSYTLDAACASSLYALKLAQEELLAHRADVMVAGGLSRPDCQYTQMGFAQLQALSKGSRCAPLSAAADGLVVGEGAGLFVLKRLSDALRDGDRVYATIAGIGLSNDRGANLLAPNSGGQLRAMRAAYAAAGWRPGDVDLIECHATGTPIGDAVELESLQTLWQDEARPARPCTLGSVKSNVGHLLTAAGSASLMKLIGALQSQTLPPTANFREPAAALQRSESPFRVLAQSQPWARRADEIPRRAAINAFGFGGINAHVLLEEFIPEAATSRFPAADAFPAEPAAAEISIAIVGLSGRIGELTSLRELQQHFFNGREWPEVAIREIRTPVTEFRIPPLELEEMLPQQQLMLQVAASAIQDAGVSRELGDRTGVFVGISLDPNTTNFHCRWMIAEQAREWAQQLGLELSEDELATWIAELRNAFGPPLTANRVMGNLGGIVASRLGREFDVGGPCFTISSDDHSGLRALDVAIRALQRGEIDQALVGAVDFRSDRRLQGDPTGERPADGAVALILQRQSDAERSGQRIYAVLNESSASVVANESAGISQVAPPALDGGSWRQLIPVVQSAVSLYQQFDAITARSVWLRDHASPRQLAVLSPLSEYGSIRQRLIEAPLAESEQTIRERRQPQGELAAALFVLTGAEVRDVLAAVDGLRERSQHAETFEGLAREWFRRPPPQADHRLAATVVAESLGELRRQLDSLRQQLAAQDSDIRERGVSFTSRPLGLTGRLAFVFPGSGNHFLGMGRELLAAFPEIARRQDQENQRLRSQYRPDVIWNAESTEAIGQDHKTMIFGQVALGTFVCDWLAEFGVRPQAAIGYSLGESAALFGLRAWRDRDEMLRRMEASSLFGTDLPRPFDAARRAWQIPVGRDVPWLSGVINSATDQVRPAVERFQRVYLLIINSPSQCVIGGERAQVEQLVRELKASFVPFAAPSTVHCPILQEVSRAYTELHLMETVPPSGIEFYSGATGQPYGLSRDAAAGAILAQALDTVDFPRVIQNAYRDGVRLFVEIGPGASCTRMIGEILAGREHAAWAVCPSTATPVRQALSVLAELITHRVPVDLTPLYGVPTAVPTHLSRPEPGRCVVTPVPIPSWVIPPLPEVRRAQSSVTLPASPAVEPLPADPLATVPAPPAPRPEDRSRPPTPAPILAPAAMTRHSAPRTHMASKSTPLSSSAAAMSTPTVTPPVDTTDPILRAWERWMQENVAAHEAFLCFSQQAQTLAADLIANPVTILPTERVSEPTPVFESPAPKGPLSAPVPTVPRVSPPATPPRALNYEQCLEYAIGKIGNVLGPTFAEIDAFPTRVRLPDIPLMLVDRILTIEGEPLSMTRGRVVTEHDIHADDWYLDCGRIPTCLAVESGQADLFLSGWLGIDFQTRGLACYRLLDAVVTFHDELPGPGQTINYDIRINGFFRQGETYLFRFEFDATVNGQPLLTMRDGCAGFFTQQELAAGQGVIHTALDRQPRPGRRPADWQDPVPLTVESYDDQQLAALRQGDLGACFGAAFAGLPLQRPVTLPSGRLNLVHRVLKLDHAAGKYGLGQIRAEADIHPDDWFLTCHFCDDQVMPGTLMYECCLHTLRVYLLRMGWIGESGDIAYEPIPGIKSRLKCRGQVLSSTRKVWYEVTLKEIGYGHPAAAGSAPAGQSVESAYAIADALMYADGKPIVEITDMSVRLTGLTREHVERLWAARPTEQTAPQASVLKRPPLFDTDRITEFAIGRPSLAFGDRYRVFDDERRIARLPGPPFQFLDRIVDIRDCEPWVLAAGGTIVAEYDVPADAWYFAANRSATMPFAVLLETALQPCGWLAAYLGSALTSDTDLSFRNLGGKAIQYQPVTPFSGTLSTTVKITRVSQSAGMVIQHFDYDLRCGGEPVYVGNTYFGFFAKAALANQVGIRDAKVYQPTAEELARASRFPVPLAPPFPDDNYSMVRRVDALVLDGGPQGLGYIRGSVDVDPGFWFFKAHFFQDPVWPGSLGLESFLQLLQVFAAACWGDSADGAVMQAGPTAPPQAPADLSWHIALGVSHEWVYRGQVIPGDKTVTVEVVVTERDDARRILTASGFLIVDGRVIYQMIDFRITARTNA